MKTVNARDLQKKIKQCVDVSQQDRVVITRRGKPAAVMVGVEGKDWEEVALQTSSTFWKLIEERRNEPTISTKAIPASRRSRGDVSVPLDGQAAIVARHPTRIVCLTCPLSIMILRIARSGRTASPS